MSFSHLRGNSSPTLLGPIDQKRRRPGQSSRAPVGDHGLLRRKRVRLRSSPDQLVACAPRAHRSLATRFCAGPVTSPPAHPLCSAFTLVTLRAHLARSLTLPRCSVITSAHTSLGGVAQRLAPPPLRPCLRPRAERSRSQISRSPRRRSRYAHDPRQPRHLHSLPLAQEPHTTSLSPAYAGIRARYTSRSSRSVTALLRSAR